MTQDDKEAAIDALASSLMALVFGYRKVGLTMQDISVSINMFNEEISEMKGHRPEIINILAGRELS